MPSSGCFPSCTCIFWVLLSKQYLSCSTSPLWLPINLSFPWRCCDLVSPYSFCWIVSLYSNYLIFLAQRSAFFFLTHFNKLLLFLSASSKPKSYQDHLCSPFPRKRLDIRDRFCGLIDDGTVLWKLEKTKRKSNREKGRVKIWNDSKMLDTFIPPLCEWGDMYNSIIHNTTSG